ncbi:uncharacterized protein BX664DRAFT_317794 [Halteromyces radiatus]|uniref:uncharacterized protein n=1 Tax=Halteromyces radiatus TaxID=101107 RepID=UPI0022207163|nr:uncharacterized protein BX664DRAFT_317794 [Halteromyces radiatus]KAI8079902.1 hypothetical protein BX664DRAFT_317794 [Halteromyces radiatus]
MYPLVLILGALIFTQCSALSNKPCPPNKKLNVFALLGSTTGGEVSPICDGNHAITCKSEPIDKICNDHIKHCKNPNYDTAFCNSQYCYCADATVAAFVTGPPPPKKCTNASGCPKCSGKGVETCENKKCGCRYPPAKPPAPSSCVDFRQPCNDQKRCCPGLYCHKRTFTDHPTCEHTAFGGDDCSSGIPCEDWAQCIGGRCSLHAGDDCDFDGAVCPYGWHCGYQPYSVAATHKVCQCDLGLDDNCIDKKRCDLDVFGVKELCQCHPGIDDHCYAASATGEKCKEACYAHNKPACKTTFEVNKAGLKACLTFETNSCKNYYMNWANQTIELTAAKAKELASCGHKI